MRGGGCAPEGTLDLDAQEMASPPPEAKDPVVEEVTAIFDLRTYKEKCQQLQADLKEERHKNYILDALLSKQRDTQADILKTLHANLDERYAKIQEQDALIQQLYEQIEDQKEAYVLRRDEEREGWSTKVDELQTRVNDLENTLDSLSEFRHEKDGIERQMDMLRRALEDKSNTHKKALSAVERNKDIEFLELKREMQKSINGLRDKMKSQTKEQLDVATKKAIMDNEQMATELQFQCQQTEQLITRNKSLTDENIKLRRHLGVHKDLEHELVRRSHVQQRLLKKFAEQRTADSTPLVESGEKADANATMKKAEMEASSRLVARARRLEEELHDSRLLNQTLRHEFVTYREEQDSLADLRDWGTREVTNALKDLRAKAEFAVTPSDTGDSFRLSRKQRDRFFTLLLETLSAKAVDEAGQTATVHSGLAPKMRMQRAASTPTLPRIGAPAVGSSTVTAMSLVEDPAAQLPEGMEETADLRQFLRTLTMSPSELAASQREEKGVQAALDDTVPPLGKERAALLAKVRSSPGDLLPVRDSGRGLVGPKRARGGRRIGNALS